MVAQKKQVSVGTWVFRKCFFSVHVFDNNTYVCVQ